MAWYRSDQSSIDRWVTRWPALRAYGSRAWWRVLRLRRRRFLGGGCACIAGSALLDGQRWPAGQLTHLGKAILKLRRRPRVRTAMKIKLTLVSPDALEHRRLLGDHH